MCGPIRKCMSSPPGSLSLSVIVVLSRLGFHALQALQFNTAFPQVLPHAQAAKGTCYTSSAKRLISTIDFTYCRVYTSHNISITELSANTHCFQFAFKVDAVCLKVGGRLHWAISLFHGRYGRLLLQCIPVEHKARL